jgi:hypothetical protein
VVFDQKIGGGGLGGVAPGPDLFLEIPLHGSSWLHYFLEISIMHKRSKICVWPAVRDSPRRNSDRAGKIWNFGTAFNPNSGGWWR